MRDSAAPGDNPVARVHLEDAARLGAGVYATVVWRHRRLLAALVVVGCVLTLLATFLVRTTYRASSSFVAASALAGKSDVAGLGALEGVAGRFGVRLGGGDDLGELFPRILRSRTLLDEVLARPLPLRDGGVDSLIAWLDPSGSTPAARRDGALRKLQGRMSAGVDARTGVVTVAVTLTDPVLAAAVANACVAELDAFAGSARRAHSSRQGDFISGRLDEVSTELAAAETTLKEFRERNRRIADSPQLLLQEGRLAREVEVAQRVFMELKAQHEIVKIEEARDVPLVIVLDEAVPPVRKHAPRRLRLLVSAAVVFLLIGLVAVVVKDAREPRISPAGSLP